MDKNKFDLPVIDLKSNSSNNNADLHKALAVGAKLFLEQGYLIIKNAYDPRFIERLREEFIEEYSDYFEGKKVEDARLVGNKRTMITLNLQGLVNSPEYYANPKIIVLMQTLLGGPLILNALGSVVALPGAEAQHIHRDHPNIYNIRSEVDNVEVVKNTLPYGITVGIPLIPLTAETGSTRFWPGTHLSTIDSKDPGIGPGVETTAELGTCILFDYRIIHSGMANNSDQIRPLMYNIYTSPWFRDSVNYLQQKTMNITMDNYRKVPLNLRPLFDWAIDPKMKRELEKLESLKS